MYVTGGIFDGLLGPTGEGFPDEDSLPVGVAVDTPDATPRNDTTGTPLLANAPGAYVNQDGLYFDADGTPLNRDTGLPLPEGTLVDSQGYLVVPQGSVASGAYQFLSFWVPFRQFWRMISEFRYTLQLDVNNFKRPSI